MRVKLRPHRLWADEPESGRRPVSRTSAQAKALVVRRGVLTALRARSSQAWKPTLCCGALEADEADALGMPSVATQSEPRGYV